MPTYTMNGSYKVRTAPLKCEQSLLKNTDGSALFSAGETVVLVGLYGPADCKESKQDVKQAVVEVNFRPKIGIPGIAEKYLEKFVRSISETVILRSLHPRTLFSIIVQVVQDQGSLLSCAINGVSMAMQDAGIAMHCLPVAVTVALYQEPQDDHDEQKESPIDIIINPSSKVEHGAIAVMTFVFDSAEKKLLSTYSMGEIAQSKYEECLLLAKEASSYTLEFFKSSISKKLSADLR